jgi:hypothetical protein
MTSDSASVSGDAADDGKSPLWLWMGCIAVGAVLLAFAWGRAPVRIKPIGISSIGLGCLFGWIAGRLARDWRVGTRILVVLTTFGAVVAGLAGSAVVAHRAGVADMEAYARAHPPQVDPIKEKFEQALSEPAPDGLSPEELRNLEAARVAHEQGERIRREYERERREYRTFYGYLENRVSAVSGKWSPPWPIVFWVIELIASAGAAGFLALRSFDSRSVPSER